MGSKTTILLVAVLTFGVGFLAPVVCRPVPGSADCLMKCCEMGGGASEESKPDCCSYKNGNRVPYVTQPLRAEAEYQTAFVASLRTQDSLILSFPSPRKSDPVPFATAPPLFLLNRSIRI